MLVIPALALIATTNVIEERETRLGFLGFVAPQVPQKLIGQAVFTAQVLPNEQENSSRRACTNKEGEGNSEIYLVESI